MHNSIHYIGLSLGLAAVLGDGGILYQARAMRLGQHFLEHGVQGLIGTG